MWIYEPTPEERAAPKRCKCGAEIIFVKTKANRTAPLNAGFEIEGRETVAGVELCKVSNGASHFATCPYSNQFRRI